MGINGVRRPFIGAQTNQATGKASGIGTGGGKAIGGKLVQTGRGVSLGGKGITVGGGGAPPWVQRSIFNFS